MAHDTERQQSGTEISHEQLIDLLNEDLCRSLEAIMVSVNYSEMIDGNADRNIAGRLAKQVHKELQQALIIAEQIRSLGGVPETKPSVVQGSDNTEEMLRFKLENKSETIRNYLERFRQCEALGEHAMARQIREILLNEQQHQIYLATALSIQMRDIRRSSINRDLDIEREDGSAVHRESEAQPRPGSIGFGTD